MKVKDYVRKYAPVVKSGHVGTCEAVAGLVADLVREGTATLASRHVTSLKEADALMRSMNDKANLITDEIERQIGRPWAHHDWFKRYAHVCKPSDGQEAE